MPRRWAAALAVAAALTLALGPAGEVGAHPLGNFTVNVYSGLYVEPDRIGIDLVVDMAEIPTFQARREVDADGDGAVSDAESSAYAARACRDAAGRVDVMVDGRPAPVRAGAGEVVFPAGAGGLPTLRLTCPLVATLGEAGGARRVEYRNRNYDDRVGWREIVAAGDRTQLAESTVPSESLSGRLTDYPADLLQSPLDQRAATFTVRPGGPALAGGRPAPAPAPAVGARGVDRFSRSFMDLVARRHLTAGFAFLAVGLSVVLGAAHALAPGHGKTLMAAYLVGRDGTFGDALLIGATMAVTHTAGVLLLGLVLSASTSLAAETVYPWLGLVSGLLLAGIGAGLLYRAARTGAGSAHEHGHPHGHKHLHPHAALSAPYGRPGLVGMGFVGGLLPSPSALVVLLGAIALRRVWFGVVLVGAYGAGMAGTLLATALLLHRAQAGIAARMATASPARVTLLTRAIPAVTATVVLGAGLFFAVQGWTRI